MHARPDHSFEVLDTGIPNGNVVDDQGTVLTAPHSALLADVNGDGAADLIQCENPPDTHLWGDEHARWTVHFGMPAVPGFDPTAVPIPEMDGRGCWLASLTGLSWIKVAD